MNEKKKLWLIFGIIGVLVCIVIVSFIINNIKFKQTLDDIDNTMQSEEIKIFYLARPTCYYCNLLKPVTETLQKEYDLTYYEINTDLYSKNQLLKILDKLEIDSQIFGTPYLVFTKKSEIIGSYSGYADENIIFDVFKTYGIIANDAQLLLNYISYEQLKNMWNDGEKHLIMIGTAGEESVNARNILKQYISQYQLSISYMDIAETENDTGYAELLSLLNRSSEITGPILMVVQNGQILSETNQFTNDAYEKFLTTNGYITNRGE